MSWEMSGTYVANCSCALLCPCPVDGPPNGPDGECRGVAVFHIENGRLDGTDLSGVDFAFCNVFPANLTAGNWKVGAVVDDGASDGQADAVGRILHGDEGGPFADFAALYGEWLGVERARVAITNGGNPTAVAGDGVNYTFEPALGADGGPTTVKNAMFAFGPEYMVGRASGHQMLMGIEFDGIYAESADFSYASEMAETAPKGRA
ncbi:DUF1326 domain-containing protein [Arthrobacter sp. 35W]|uniref:DUF1326 domain-containing protein n=1 Tax=Arthrobacter sp. 35W TaxID=1132441 RepID=UPI0004089AA5|nr:DUF1326 domain-containing protein [Arthrobacter sp. 35W]